MSPPLLAEENFEQVVWLRTIKFLVQKKKKLNNKKEINKKKKVKITNFKVDHLQMF